MKKILIRIFILISILSLTACGSSEVAENNEADKIITEKSTRKPNSVVGKWYEILGVAENGTVIWEFTEKGKMRIVDEETYYDEEIIRTYSDYIVEENKLIKNSKSRIKEYKIEYTQYGLLLTLEENPKITYKLYESKEDGLLSHPDYKKSIQYYKTIADEDGYVIENGELIKYVGDAKEITIPDSVKVIKKGAITYGEETLRKVTIPGTVKEIEEYAVNEMGITHIYIEEGVEEIGKQAIRQTNLEEIYFPESLKEMGEYVIEPGELELMSDDFEIHVKKGSYAEEYFTREVENIGGKIIIEER